MRADLVDLQEFYSSRQGHSVRHLINLQIKRLWRDMRGLDVLGIGYPLPFLSGMEGTRSRVALMPATQGACRWAHETGNRTMLGREDELPFPDQAFDRVILAHALESSPHPNRLLREVWRLLKDEGRLIVLVPNRRGLWCWSENTPFGYGQPYSSGQIDRLLENHLFDVAGEQRALFMPPVRGVGRPRVAVGFERVGLRLLRTFAGVLIVEAQKKVYCGTAVMAKLRPSSRRYLPIPDGVAASQAIDTTESDR